MILFPCRIHPQKRPFLMLEIAKELEKIMPDAAIVVVGDGPQLKELEEAVIREKLENTVYFAGRRNDMRPWYRDASLTMICSLKEGIALTAYESLSMGVPVVSSDVGGQGELIDETVGCILPLMQSEATDSDNRDFSREEISQYAEAIKKFLADKEAYAKMSAACRSRIESGFSLDLAVRRLEGCFTALVRNEQ